MDDERVRDLVLKGFDEASCLATLLSLVADLIEGRIDVVGANWFHWRAVGAVMGASIHLCLGVRADRADLHG
jgi:hypothetical protein